MPNRAEGQIEVQCVVFDFRSINDDSPGHEVAIAKDAEIMFSVRGAFLAGYDRHVAILARLGGVRRLGMLAHGFLHAIDTGTA